MEALYLLGAIVGIALLSTISFLHSLKQQKEKHNEIMCNECVKLHPGLNRDTCKKQYCTYYEEINEILL